MSRKKRIGLALLAAAALTVGGGHLLYPLGEEYVKPMVEKQLNTSINGTATYDSLDIRWNGTIEMKGLTVTDMSQRVVAQVPSVAVSLSPLNAVKMMWNDASAISLIDTVTVTGAQLHIVQESDKHWNIVSLIRSDESDTSMDYRGSVVIKDSAADIRLANGRQIALTTINGAVAFDGYPSIKAGVTAVADGQDISLRGSYTANEQSDFSLYVKAPRITLDYANDILPDSLRGIIKGGMLTDAAVSISRENGVFRYGGSVALKELSLDYDGYAIRNGAARIMFNDDRAVISNGRLAVNNQQLFANGVIALGDDEPQFDMRLQGHELDLAALADKGITGRVGGEVYIRGTAKNPSVYGRLRGRDIAYEGYHIDEIGADVRYENSLVTVEEFDGRIGDGHIAGRGTYDMERQAFEVRGNARQMPLGLASAIAGRPLYGTVSGSFYASGSDGELRDVQAVLHGEHIGTAEMQFDTADVQVAGSGKRYMISYANATAGKGALTAYGTIDDKTLNIRFGGTDLPLSLLNGAVGQAVSGHADMHGEVTGTLDAPTVRGHIAAHDIEAAGLSFKNGYTVFALENNRLTFSPAALQTADGGAYLANGYVDITGDNALDVIVETKKTRIEHLAKAVTDVPVTGWVTAKTHITGTVAAPKLRGFVHAWDGSVYGKLFTDVKLAYSYSPQGIVIHRFDASAYGATISGEGTVKDNALDINLLGETIWLEPWLKDCADVRGYMTAEGHVGGTTDKPVFTGTIGARDVSINGIAFSDVHGEIYADPTVLNFNNLSVNAGEGGRFNVKGGMTLNGMHRLFGYATVENSNIADIAKLLNTPLRATTGFLNGRLDLGGTLKNPDITVIGKIKDITIKDTLLGTADIDATLQNRRVSINTLRIPVVDGVLAAQGTADLDGAADIQIAAANVPVAVLMPATGSDLDVQGNLNFIANISGETRNPKVELSTDLTKGVINGVTVDRTYALATMENKVIHIQQLVGQRGDYKVRVAGDIPLAALYTSGYLPPGDNDAMNVTLDVSEADLAVLPLMSSAVTEGVGPLKGKLTVTGTYGQPEIRGTVGVDDGTIAIKGVKKPLEHINATVRFDGRRAELIGSADMGKGSMGISGELAWQGTTVNHYYGLVQFNGLEVEHDYFKGPLQGELGITPVNGLPTIVGHIDLDSTTMAVPLDLASSEGGTPFGLDVTVNVGKKVQLYSSGLYDLRIGGGAHFGGTTTTPDIDGGFHVVNGSVKYLNNRFTIMEGKASFMPGSYLPYLQVKGFANVQTYKIGLQIDGPATEMKLKLTSEPHLEERQIISLLTFGYTTGNDSSVGSDDANALLAAGLRSVALGYVEGAVRNTLGLDLVNITTGALDPREAKDNDTSGYYNIELGKYLLPNVMVTVSRGLNNDYSSYGIRYDLNRNFSINGWHNSDSHSYLGGSWRYEF